MGIILGRFRKKKSTLEQLEKLDDDIKSIEAFRLNTELAQRRIVGHFILVSAGIYILVAIVFYFYFFPATFYDQIFYITPLLLVPFIIWFVKRLLTWYYKRKISRNESKLSVLRNEKKKLLDQVMDTETYKVAKNILEKFAPDQLRKSTGPYEMTPYKTTSNANVTSLQTPATLRQRNIVVSNRSGLNVALQTPKGASAPNAAKTPAAPAQPTTSANGQQGAGAGAAAGAGTLSVIRQAVGMPTPLPMPREILPRERSVLDRMVEYLVGDGPSNRFALICKNCQSHNGMALREEFEYVSFRCCYCYSYNPARKLRPIAPKLEFVPRTPKVRRDSDKSTSDSEKNSATDTDSDERNPFKTRSETLANKNPFTSEDSDEKDLNATPRRNSETGCTPMELDSSLEQKKIE